MRSRRTTVALMPSASSCVAGYVNSVPLAGDQASHFELSFVRSAARPPAHDPGESLVHQFSIDRRSGIERRQITLAAFYRGALNPRRKAGRRSSDRYAIIDWHSPRVLALVLGILGFCVLDGVLTILLLSHGAREINPLLATFVPHNLFGFAAVKLGLTGAGLCVLVACSRMRLFRRVSGEAFLYGALAAYVALISYQLHMLARVPV